MEYLPIVRIVGYSAVAVVVLAWLVVSFSRGGALHQRAARVGATGLYLALACLFANLSLRAWDGGHWLVIIAFGFLLAVFTGGFFVSLVKTVAAFGRSKGAAQHATH